MKTITLRHPSGEESTGGKTKRTKSGVLQSLTTLWLLCAKEAAKVSRKVKDKSKISPDSPMIQRPKKLMATISNKAIKIRHHRKKPESGDDGLWQREILMGDKCQPLDFSGVINYDRDGKRTDEFPGRSPRLSSFPSGYVAKFDWVPPHER
ncbi:uncharacterized protein LOC143608155 [Bidens hawaiensis]|uniref:uncharacterized protein LOC143608155 n=1 Tax=Bidens hawaiensis TaxID=980011 RepID=UPI00404B12AE